MGRVPGTAEWGRSAPVAGGGEVTALDLVRSAAVVGHDGLAGVKSALAAARR